jgi:hypothetical protein
MQKGSKFTNLLASGEIEDKLYVIKQEKKEYSMMIFDTQLKLLKEVPFKKKNCKDGDCIDSNFGYVKTLFFEDRILVLFQSFEKTSKNRLLFCQTFNKNGDFVGELTVIDNIPATIKSNSGSFMIEYCNDKTKFLIIQNNVYDKKADEKFSFKVYDKELKNLSNSSIQLPYKDKKTSVVNYYLSDKGDVYMLLKVELEKSQKERGEDNKFYSVLTLKTSEDNSLIEHKIQLPQRKISSIDLQIDNINNVVACAGLYSDMKPSGKTNDIDGFFFLNMNMEDGEILSQSYMLFDKDLVARLIGKEGKKVKDNKGISTTFKVQDIAKLSDGSTYIIAENNYVVITQTCNSNGACTTRYTYYSLNILAIKISPEGEIETLIDVPKKQVGSTDRYLSHMLMQKGDNMLLVYNDNPVNISPNAKSISDMKFYNKTKKGAVMMVELFSDGRYSKTKLFDAKTKKIIAIPRSGFRMDDGAYILPTISKGNSFGFVKFNIE